MLDTFTSLSLWIQEDPSPGRIVFHVWRMHTVHNLLWHKQFYQLLASKAYRILSNFSSRLAANSIYDFIVKGSTCFLLTLYVFLLGFSIQLLKALIIWFNHLHLLINYMIILPKQTSSVFFFVCLFLLLSERGIQKCQCLLLFKKKYVNTKYLSAVSSLCFMRLFYCIWILIT